MRIKTVTSRANRIEHYGYWFRLFVSDNVHDDICRGHRPILYNRLSMLRLVDNDNDDDDKSKDSDHVEEQFVNSKL